MKNIILYKTKKESILKKEVQSMPKKNFTLEEINHRFKQKYPEGGIFKSLKKGRYSVYYKEKGKVYDYAAGSPYQLAMALELVSEEEISERKGIVRLPCGCPVAKIYADYFKCSNCGKPWRQPTAEEEAEEKKRAAEWGC